MAVKDHRNEVVFDGCYGLVHRRVQDPSSQYVAVCRGGFAYTKMSFGEDVPVTCLFCIARVFVYGLPWFRRADEKEP